VWRSDWNWNCSVPIVAAELVLGRLAAWCVHPAAAWVRLPPSGRTLLVAVYVAASYLTVLTALAVLS
jgi:hypothetical protein